MKRTVLPCRCLVLTAALTLAHGAGAAPPAPAGGACNLKKMSLKEKRNVPWIQEKLKEPVAELTEKCGAPIPLQVDWESFQRTGRLADTKDGVASVCGRVATEVAKVCRDDEGKEAVIAQVKKIVCTGQKAYRGPGIRNFKNGVLTEDIHLMKKEGPAISSSTYGGDLSRFLENEL